MIKYKKIIFLDEDNTALGPLVAELLKIKLAERKIEELNVSSAGNVVLFSEPVNQKIEELAKDYGLDMGDYKSCEIKDKDFQDSTLILALDNDSKSRTYSKYPNAMNVYLLKEFLGSTGDIKLPLGGSVDDYRLIAEMVGKLLDALVQKLFDN